MSAPSLSPIPRDRDGRIEFPEDAWRDNEETRANLSRIIAEDDEDAAREWYDERTPEPTMCLKIGRVPYPVRDLADASRVYQIVRDESGKGSSAFPIGRVGEYLISYNGRVWEKGDHNPGRPPVLEATPLVRSVCTNCGEKYTRITPCFDHCPRCIPNRIAPTIRTVADLRRYQRAHGADV